MASAARFTDVRTVQQVTADRWQDRSIPAFGKGIKGSQCYTVDGTAYWSYSTCIAAIDTNRQWIVLSVTRYSATTNRFMSMLQQQLPDRFPGFHTIFVDPSGFNVTPEDLLALAFEQINGGNIAPIGDPVDPRIAQERRTMRNGYGQVIGTKPNRSTLI